MDKKTEKKIKQLKKTAKQSYLAYTSYLDEFDCSADLAEYMSPRLWEYKNEFNKAMDELSLLEKDIPTFRL